LVSLDADGFTVNYAAAPVGAYLVGYLALGGSDLTNVKVSQHLTPATAVEQAYTGAGFQPDFALFFVNQSSSTDDDTFNHAFTSMGYMNATEQATGGTTISDGRSTPNRKYRVQETTNVMRQYSQSGNQLTTADPGTSRFNADGFTLDFTDVAGTQRYFSTLLLKGGEYDIISTTSPTSTGADQVTSTVSPLAIFLQSFMAGVIADRLDNSRLALGVGTGPGETWASMQYDKNEPSSEASRRTESDEIIGSYGPTTTVAEEANLVSMDEDAFTLNWGVADSGTARHIIGWAVGNSLPTTADDDSGNSHDGTYTNGPLTGQTSLSGEVGDYAASFDAVNDHVVIVAHADFENIFDGGGSAEFLMNPASDGENDVGIVIAKRFSSVGWKIYTAAESGGNVKLVFHIDFSTADGVWETAVNIPIGTKSHIVITYDADAVGNNPTVYVGGAARTVGSGLTRTSTPEGTRLSDSGLSFVAGKEGAGNHFDGVIDEVALYASVLSAARVTAHFDEVS
jgi:hypothetical protein